MSSLARLLVAVMAFGLGARSAPAQDIFLPDLIGETAVLQGTSVASLTQLFGRAVDTDGNLLVVGAPENDSSTIRGQAFIYERSDPGPGWTFVDTLAPPVDNPTYGYAVAVEGDVVVVGPTADDTVEVYRRTGAAFELIQEIEHSLPSYFVGSVALDGGTLVMGAADFSGVQVWQFQEILGFVPVGAPLTPPDTTQAFGAAIAIDGDTMLVGASGDDGTVLNSGAVYVFVRNGGTWTFQQKLTLAVQFANDNVGRELAIHGDRAVLGVARRSSFQGAAYVFERTGSLWTQRQELVPSHRNAFQQYGSGVAIEGDLAVVGATGDSFVASSAGRAYLFERSPGGTWTEIKTLVPSNVQASDGHGAGVAFDNGTLVMGGDDCCPDKLRSVAVFEEDLSDDLAVNGALRAYLFPSDAAAGGQSEDDAAFRFQERLFNTDNPEAQIRAAIENMSGLYGPAEIDRSVAVESKLREALGVAPGSTLLRDLLLDIFYHRVAAAQILAGAPLESAALARLDLPPPAPGLGVIDDEIFLLEEALDRYRLALRGAIPGVTPPGGYVDLVQDDLGDPNGAEPLGARIFRTRVPVRGLQAATTADGTPVIDCTAPCELFPGYKDLVLLLGLLRDAGRTADELARLYLMRGSEPDLDAARDLLAELNALLTAQGTLYLGFFPALAPTPGDPSALAEAIAGWEKSLEALGTKRQLLEGNANALGFADDFLIFMQKRDEFVGLFDSYDIFEAFLIPGSSTSPLESALDELGAAQTSYSDFKGFEDQLAGQFSLLTNRYRDRILLIVGAFPGDEGFDTPELNVGSEIWQQIQSIEGARLTIQLNRQEIANLQERVQIEIERRGKERGINGAIHRVILDYGEKQAKITETIGHINAAQAATNEMVDMFSIENLTKGTVFLGIVNVAVQTAGEEEKGQLEAEKERLAATEKAEIRDLEDQILDANSKAQIKSWLLDMNTLAIESQQAALLMRQEIGRLKGLYDERDALLNAIAEASGSLTERFFADPVHRLRFQSDEFRAKLSFEAAQRWVYFMIRALEYKWNTPFDQDWLGRTWTVDSVFGLRNARELDDLYQAMVQFNQIRESTPFEPGILDVISLRKDVLGLRILDGEGQPVLYDDPITGDPVGAIQAFRSFLRTVEDAGGNPRIRFSTVREFPGRNLFLGPIFFPDGTVDSPGTTLDKIEWLVVQIPGSHSSGAPTVRGDLRYGGTSFIRSPSVGQPSATRPDRVENELAAYTTRFWFQDIASGDFRSTEALTAPIQMSLTLPAPTSCNFPGVDPIEVFQERSVATSDWELVLRPEQGGVQVLDLDEIDDVEIYVCHRWVLRAP